jgi:hypothetical protein
MNHDNATMLISRNIRTLHSVHSAIETIWRDNFEVTPIRTKTEKHEIRLLHLQPRGPTNDAAIVCRFETVNLDGRLAYEALSYEWASPTTSTNQFQIMLNGSVAVRENLWWEPTLADKSLVFFLTSTGMVGSASHAVEVGDLICAIEGGQERLAFVSEEKSNSISKQGARITGKELEVTRHTARE